MDGNNADQVAHLHEKTLKFAEEMRTSTLSRTDVWFALERCMMMTIEYCLPAVTLTAPEWKKVMAPIMRYVLPKAGIDSHFPRRLLFAPKEYQGIGLMHPWHRQCITHISTLISESLKNTITGALIKQVLEGTRLEVGVSGSFWNRSFVTFKPIVTPCWISEIWEYTSQHQITLEDPFVRLETYWSKDIMLMDVFGAHYTGEDLRRLNHCRMFLRVTCLSEISRADGSKISFDAWNGFPSESQWNAYEWPRRQSHISKD